MTTWSCSHTLEMPNRRCINCCRLHPRNYVQCAALGGTPTRWRWLCDPCLAFYRSLGMLAEQQRTYMHVVGGHGDRVLNSTAAVRDYDHAKGRT